MSSFLNEKKLRKYILKEIRRRGVIEFTPPGRQSYTEVLAESAIKFLNHVIKCQLEELTDPETFRDGILDSLKIQEAARKAGRDPAEVSREMLEQLKRIPVEVVPKRSNNGFNKN